MSRERLCPDQSAASPVGLSDPVPVENNPGHEFYRDLMQALAEAQVPFLIGGGFAFACFTGIERARKDLDLFLRPEHFARAIEVASGRGYRTSVRFAHWLGKACHDGHFVDIIFDSGNSLCPVDEDWFTYAVPGEVLDLSVNLSPPEEMIWSKAFVMESDRFDGADVAHLIHAQGHNLNWLRLMQRFGPQWRVLLSHLILFGFVYPAERSRVPDWVMGECLRRLKDDMDVPAPREQVCQGTLLSWSEYLTDVEQGDYKDGRLPPRGNLTREQIAGITEIWRRGEEPGGDR